MDPSSSNIDEQDDPKGSRLPATSTDILRLEEHLDRELEREEAREMGICPVRRRLYDELMSELVRQEMVACPERGKLLKNIQEECQLSLRMAINCYESAIAYGLKKSLSSRIKLEKLTTGTMLSNLVSLEEEATTLEQKLTDMRLKAEDMKMPVEWKEEEDKITAENEYILKQMLDSINIIIEMSE